MENVEQDYIKKLFEVASGKVFKCQKGHSFRLAEKTPSPNLDIWKCIRCGKVLK
jgi:hypothetical protein